MGPVIIDIQAYELESIEREKLQHPLVGGLILFARNYADKAQLQALVKDIRKTVNKPFLISVDHEGGRVQRFLSEFTHIPSASAIELSSDKHQQQQEMAKAMGLVMASELINCDIDLSFAPVLDLNGISEVITCRAFSSEPEQVISLAGKYIEGMRLAGMASTGKHFPGHGSVKEDSHIAMPCDSRELEAIEQLDMRVFSALIKQNLLDAIMPAHVIYDKVDALPAGFSAFWLQTMLRQRLAFDGVIFSDDLSMQAASVAGDVVERAHTAIQAGCDMVLVCNSPTQSEQVLDGLPQNQSYTQRAHKLLLGQGARTRLQTPQLTAQIAQSRKLILEYQQRQ